MHVGSVVRARVVVTESTDEGEVTFAQVGELGEVLEVFDGGTLMVAWPGGVAECDSSELEPNVDDSHLADSRAASA